MMLFRNLIDASGPPEHKVKIDLPSPLTGQVKPLDDVPCSLFQQRLLGEGAAIQASGYHLLAPLDCIVTEFPPTAHRIRLKTKQGLRLQIQCGLDGHLNHGVGFKRKVAVGQKVKQGTVLLEFDLRKVKNSMDYCDFIVTLLNANRVKGIELGQNKVIANEDTLFSVYI